MPGFYAEYFDGTTYTPCVFKKFDGTNDTQVYQVTYFNGTSDVVIGTLPAQNYMNDGFFDFNVANGTSIADFGWDSPTNHIISGNALQCAAGKGTWGVTSTFNSSISYQNIEFMMKAGFTGSHSVYAWGGANNNYLVVSPSSVQLRIGGVWQNQASGTFSNSDTLFGIHRSGSNVVVKVNNIAVFTVSNSTMAAGGSVVISMVPGTNTTTSSMDYIRWY